jgi:osmoprotectant transport system permease protein
VSDRPLIDWDWIGRNLDDVAEKLLEHLQLTGIAVGVGLLISLPLGIYAYRHRRAYGPVAGVSGLLYTIPSLALFAFMVPYTGLTVLTAEIGLVSYTLLILIRNIVAGLDGVSPDVKEAARGMGLSDRQLLWRVEIPIALPAIMAGVRIAAVSTIALVTVTALIGLGGVGHFIVTIGIRRLFLTAGIVGAVLSVLLALAVDGLLLWAQRRATPWARARTEA